MKINYYQKGLNVYLVTKALTQEDPRTLVRWRQLACEVENWAQMVEAISQNKPTADSLSWEEPKPSGATLEKDCRLWQGRCLRCGASDRSAAKCPEAAKEPMAPVRPGEILHRVAGRPLATRAQPWRNSTAVLSHCLPSRCQWTS